MGVAVMSDSPMSAARCSGCPHHVALRFGLLLVVCVSIIASSASRSWGGPLFAAAFSFDTGPSPSSVAMGDLNGDGKPDLVTANRDFSTVSVLLGNGDGTFGAKVDYGTGGHPQSVAIGDVSGDGKPDLVTANNNPSTVSVLLGDGDGTFGARADYGAGNVPRSVAIGDVSGDGKPDLAVANLYSTTSALVCNEDM